MEYRRAGTAKTETRRRAIETLAAAVCSGSVAALRPGEMVSGRITAALGICLPLAKRWAAHMGKPGVVRRRDEALWFWRKAGGRICVRAGPAARVWREMDHACVRRRVLLHVERTPAARECRSLQIQSEAGRRT